MPRVRSLLLAAPIVGVSILPGCTASRDRESDSSRSSADSTWRYAPRSKLVIGKYEIENVSLQLAAAWLTLRAAADSSVWRQSLCADYAFSSDTLYLRCNDTPIGTVTIRGRFLDQRKPRGADIRPPAGTLSALMTVEKARRVVYRRRSTFTYAQAIH